MESYKIHRIYLLLAILFTLSVGISYVVTKNTDFIKVAKDYGVQDEIITHLGKEYTVQEVSERICKTIDKEHYDRTKLIYSRGHKDYFRVHYKTILIVYKRDKEKEIVVDKSIVKVGYYDFGYVVNYL